MGTDHGASLTGLAQRWLLIRRKERMSISYRRNEVQSSPEKKELRGDLRLWTLLEEAGNLQIRELMHSLQTMAPRPGSLVYLEPLLLEVRWNDLQPIVFRAIDVCTHLQIARIYHTATTASTVDFLQFAVEQFPFEINEIRTSPDPLFIDFEWK